MKAVKLMFVCLLLMAVIGRVILDRDLKIVKAVGTSQWNVAVAATRSFTTAYAAWSAVVVENPAYSSSTGATINEDCGSGGTWRARNSILQFSLSTLPAGIEITSVQVWMYVLSKNVYNDPGWDPPYHSLYRTHPGANLSLGSEDIQNFRTYSTRVSEVKSWSHETEGQWTVYNINSVYWSTVLTAYPGTSSTYLEIVGEDYALKYSPGTWKYGAGYSLVWEVSGGNAAMLVVNYLQPPAARTVPYDTNAAVNPTPLGTEVADNITWASPRCAYADEAIWLKVNGESGANINVSLVDDFGNVLETSGNESVRTDGNYDFVINLDPGYSGWVRAIESVHKLVSPWGRVEKAPSSTQQNLQIQVLDTSYPQYDYEFSKYLVKQDGLMYVYWKTNMEAGDMANYNLLIRAGGDNTTGQIYNQTMAWLNTNYFRSYSSCNFLAHWRYAIFSPQIISAGFNTRDGLIQDLQAPYTIINRGFLQPIIIKSSDNTSLTWTHSACFYIQQLSDGVSISMPSIVNAGSEIKAIIKVGSACKVASQLSNLTALVIDDEGNILRTDYGGVSVGENAITTIAPTVNGNYQVRFIFSDSSKVPDYQYIHDMPFTVGGGTDEPGAPLPQKPPGVKDWVSWINSLLAKYNLDNELGHWLVIMVLCVIWAVAFRKHAAIATALILLTIAGAFLAKWVNPFVVVLLCLSAAGTIYAIFRKKTKSTGAEE